MACPEPHISPYDTSRLSRITDPHLPHRSNCPEPHCAPTDGDAVCRVGADRGAGSEPPGASAPRSLEPSKKTWRNTSAPGRHPGSNGFGAQAVGQRVPCQHTSRLELLRRRSTHFQDRTSPGRGRRRCRGRRAGPGRSARGAFGHLQLWVLTAGGAAGLVRRINASTQGQPQAHSHRHRWPDQRPPTALIPHRLR